MWKSVKSSHILKNFFQYGRKILALLLWCSAWRLSEKLSAHESNSGKTLAAPSLVSLQKKNYSSLIYQTIDLSGICSIFFKAVLDKNLILWTCSFLAPKWFYDTLAEHIGSKSILIHWGNFLFRESSDDFCIGPLVISSITTPWSSWGF